MIGNPIADRSDPVRSDPMKGPVKGGPTSTPPGATGPIKGEGWLSEPM
jgi:hypothetical protein